MKNDVIEFDYKCSIFCLRNRNSVSLSQCLDDLSMFALFLAFNAISEVSVNSVVFGFQFLLPERLCSWLLCFAAHGGLSDMQNNSTRKPNDGFICSQVYHCVSDVCLVHFW